MTWGPDLDRVVILSPTSYRSLHGLEILTSHSQLTVRRDDRTSLYQHHLSNPKDWFWYSRCPTIPILPCHTHCVSYY